MTETPDIVEQWTHYIMRYQGSCRDCADECGTCPSKHLTCDGKGAEFAAEAILYGLQNGYIQTPTIEALTAERDELRAKLEAAGEAIDWAVGWFEGYAIGHTAKGTNDGLRKAKTNAGRAAKLSDVATQIRSADHAG